MLRIMQTFNKVERIMLFISQIAIMVMMVLTSLDSVGRYLFNQPIIGAYEFTERYLMVSAIFLSMSFVMRLDGHISLDLLVERFSERLKEKLNIVHYLLSAAFWFLIAYLGMIMTLDAFIQNQVSSGLIAWPTWLSIIWVPIGSFLLMIRLLLMIIDIFLKLLNPASFKEEKDL